MEKAKVIHSKYIVTCRHLVEDGPCVTQLIVMSISRLNLPPLMPWAIEQIVTIFRYDNTIFFTLVWHLWGYWSLIFSNYFVFTSRVTISYRCLYAASSQQCTGLKFLRISASLATMWCLAVNTLVTCTLFKSKHIVAHRS